MKFYNLGDKTFETDFSFSKSLATTNNIDIHLVCSGLGLTMILCPYTVYCTYPGDFQVGWEETFSK